MNSAEVDSKSKLAIKELKKQNEKLRSELTSLKTVLNQAIHKRKLQEKESKRPNFKEIEDKELSALYSRIEKLKKERHNLQIEVFTNEDTNIVDLQNQVKFLKQRLKTVSEESKTLGSVAKNQEGVISGIDTSQTYKERSLKIKQEIKTYKEKYRHLLSQMKFEELQWKQTHEKMLKIGVNIRKAKSKSEVRKRPPRVGPQSKTYEDLKVEELKKKVQIIKKAISSEETTANRVISDSESKNKAMELEIRTLQKKIKAKNEESMLKDLKLNELKGTVKALKQKVLEKIERDKSLVEKSLASESLVNKSLASESVNKSFDQPFITTSKEVYSKPQFHK